MLKRFLETNDDAALLVARLALGIAIIPHGAQKLLGWFGGHGFSGTIQGFEQSGIPVALAVLVILAESLGAFSLLFGFLSRLQAFGIGSVMIGAVLTVHASNGFFMNWTGQKAGEGFEYHILALGLALAILIGGGGKWSLDRALASKLEEKESRTPAKVSV